VFEANNILKNRKLHVDFMANAGVNDTVTPKSDTVNDTVFNLIKENPTITAEEIRIKLNIGIATVKRKIKTLKEKGIITRLGSDKTGSWKVN
jgi:predicted HTH transcriptional regulator